MRPADEVKAELKASGVGFLTMTQFNVGAIATLLAPDEAVLFGTQAKMAGAGGVIVATSARVLMMERAPSKSLARAINLPDVTACDLRTNIASGTVTIVERGRRVAFDVVDAKRAAVLRDLVAERITATPEDAAGPIALACPRCGSEQFAANQKGFGVGKALVGGILTGGVGLLAGFIGSSDVKVTCIQCGHEWNAGNH